MAAGSSSDANTSMPAERGPLDFVDEELMNAIMRDSDDGAKPLQNASATGAVALDDLFMLSKPANPQDLLRNWRTCCALVCHKHAWRGGGRQSGEQGRVDAAFRGVSLGAR